MITDMKTIKRVQTGVRIEARTLKVLKATAEYLDLSLGQLIEAMTWHAFEGQSPFSEATQAKITQLREVYGLDLGAADSHATREAGDDK